MEILRNIPTSDRLRSLSHNSLFWFLENADTSKVEHSIIDGNTEFGHFFGETLASGSEGKLNEDSLAILPMGRGRTLFAVFDGASSQKKIASLSAEDISGAFYISHLASFGFEKTQEYRNLCKTPELTAMGIMIVMNTWLRDRLCGVPGIDYSDIPSVPGMAAAFVLADIPQGRLTVSQVADTTIAIVRPDGGIKIVTPNLNEKFDAETMAFVGKLAIEFNTDLAHIRKIPEANELIRKHLAESFTRKTNKKGGCGIMNGMSEMIGNRLVYTEMMPLHGGIESILIFSDGAIQPYTGCGVPLEKSVRGLAASIVAGQNGTRSPLLTGATLLDQDPDFTKIPRLKHRDDSTVLMVSTEQSSNSLPLAV